MDTVKAYWEKVVAAVKSSPATFGYGFGYGVVAGWLLSKIL